MINFKNLFKGKSVEPTTTPAQPVKREFGPTKKKKNTYVLHLNTMTMPGAFSWCNSTPLAVVKLNGVETKNAQGGFMSCTEFPNPGAAAIKSLWHMAPEWRIIMGDKMASTIIEYLDKESGQPVLLMYPTGRLQSMVANEDEQQVFDTRLNRPSRYDAIYQHKRIAEKSEIVNPLLKYRKEQMQKAPKDPQARAEFFNELNRLAERARQIMAARQNQQ